MVFPPSLFIQGNSFLPLHVIVHILTLQNSSNSKKTRKNFAFFGFFQKKKATALKRLPYLLPNLITAVTL
jgi:hypothetical protein